MAIAKMGCGSLAGTLVTRSPSVAAQVIPILAAWHGRMLVLDAQAAVESTGHVSPCYSSSRAGPDAQVVAKNSEACGQSNITCSAPRSKARPPCWR